MRPGFIFGQGTDTPDAATLQRRRSIADQLIEASLMRAPQTFGEGLTAIGLALAGRMQDRRVTEQENRAREAATGRFSEIMGALGLGGQSEPSGGSQTPSNGFFPEASPSQGNGGRQPGALMQPFMQAVQAGGVTNPYALAAIAATGIHESGFDPANAARTWSDPSESGQPGTSGGIMSWRGPRLAAMQEFAAGDMSAERQAAFFLQENPQLVQQLNAAQSADEAASIMANAWRFAGYNRPGGEAAARAATAASLVPQFGGQPQAPMPQAAPPLQGLPAIGPMQPAAPTPVDVAQAATQQGAVDTAVPFLMGVSGQSGNEVALVRMPDGTTQRLPARMQGGSVMIEGLGMSGGVGEPVQMQRQPVAPVPMAAPQAPAAQRPMQPQAGGISPTVLQLAELVQNPYLPEGQRAVAQMLLQQQMQGMDPMRTIEMERARLELEALRNPQANIPDSVLALQLRAEAAGLTPGTPEYQNFMMTGGRGGPDTVVNVGGDAGPRTGTIPPGFMLIGEGENLRMAPIPGGPAETEAAASDEQSDLRREQALRSGAVVVEDLGRVAQALEESTLPVAGPIGGLLARIPGTNAFDVSQLLDTVRANIGFDRLTQMREASPTGGALGSVTERELSLLQSVLGNLSQSQSPEQFQRNLERVNEIYTEVVHGPAPRGVSIADWSRQAWGIGDSGSSPSALEENELPPIPEGMGLNERDWRAMWNVMTEEERAMFR